MAALDHNAPVPLYIQLRDELRREIETNERPPGSPMETEAALTEKYAVSRATVRAALQELAQSGLLTTRQGVGRTVAEPRLTEELPALSSFSAVMHQRGCTVSSRVLSKERKIPPAEISAQLGIDPGTKVLCVWRQRFVEGEPVVLSTSYLVPDVQDVHDFSRSIYGILEDHYGFTISSGTASIEADAAGPEEARLLRLASGAPLLRITWLTLTTEGRAIEYSESSYRGDRYRYVVSLIAHAAEPVRQ